MNRTSIRLALAAAALAVASVAGAEGALEIRGKVVGPDGKPVRGATVSAFDHSIEKSTSVYSTEDGSFAIAGLPAREHELRVRLIGLEDAYLDVEPDATEPVTVEMEPAEELQMQRPAHHLINLLEWENEDDKQNFRMMCTYCHQIGTIGWRSPEEPVDWEVMITRMDGFAGLYPHTKETIVKRIVDTYAEDAMEKWPDYTPPEPPSGDSLKARVEEWAMGAEDNCMIHDLEVGLDGKLYIVDMINDAVVTLDPGTGERVVHTIPDGKEYGTDDLPTKGPHSIEMAANGDMWMTLALSGEMAKFNPKSGEFTVCFSGENNRRGFYPHTLRVAADGVVWYTDAGMNSVFKLVPETLAVKRYQLPRPEAEGPRTQIRGEGGAIVPYGISIAPDGRVWYTKLNGQRLGVIDPKTDEIKEWKPPIHGPRRHEVAADGLVWVPGFGSGNFASFNPATEEWKIYDLPGDGNALPYALSVHPTTGDIWICGTGMDTMMRFDPKTGQLDSYNMPTRVTYTREVEFDKDGAVWVCNSNYPARHIENHKGSLIKIALPN